MQAGRDVRVWDLCGRQPAIHETTLKETKPMGDKSPKSVNKKAAQKQSKNNSSMQKKQQAASAKQAVQAKKK